MGTNLTSMPGYRLNEYLLVLQPGEALLERIRKTKEEIAELGSTGIANRGASSILLAKFYQYEMMEQRIVNRLALIAMGYPAFKVELKDFGSFPSHTIYINAASKKPIQFLVKTIRRELQRLVKINEEHKPYFISEPHLSVAAKLQHYQFEKIWKSYQHKHFTGRFIARQICLLKSVAGRPEKNFFPLKHFPFQNLPIATRQGELFQ